MGDLVHNALRRKLAAAEAIGDLEHIDRLREMMGRSPEVPSKASWVVTDWEEVISKAKEHAANERVEPPMDQVTDLSDVTDLDVEATSDPDW